jgi:hypothetical protein
VLVLSITAHAPDPLRSRMRRRRPCHRSSAKFSVEHARSQLSGATGGEGGGSENESVTGAARNVCRRADVCVLLRNCRTRRVRESSHAPRSSHRVTTGSAAPSVRNRGVAMPNAKARAECNRGRRTMPGQNFALHMSFKLPRARITNRADDPPSPKFTWHSPRPRSRHMGGLPSVGSACQLRLGRRCHERALRCTSSGSDAVRQCVRRVWCRGDLSVTSGMHFPATHPLETQKQTAWRPLCKRTARSPPQSPVASPLSATWLACWLR